MMGGSPYCSSFYLSSKNLVVDFAFIIVYNETGIDNYTTFLNTPSTPFRSHNKPLPIHNFEN